VSDIEVIGRSKVPLTPIDTDTQMVDLENDALLSGRFVPIIGNDEVHIAQHGAMVDSETFRLAPRQGQMSLLMHLSGHIMKRSGGEPVRVEQRSE
jgi:hypothetical protein